MNFNVEKFNTKAIVIDSRNFIFPLYAETQKIIADRRIENFTKMGIKKLAFIVSSEIFAQVSIELAYNSDNNQMLETKYFHDFEKAKEWVLAK